MNGSDLDHITFELLRNTMETIVDEMTLTMVRTAYSSNIRDGMDFSTAVCDARGQMVAQGICIALHLGSIPDAMDAVTTKFASDIHPGDIFILNDPYAGGSHLTDIFLFKPVFDGDELMAFLVIVADHVDIGGRAPGGRAVDSTEIYQEGLRIPPLKLQKRGKPVAAIWEMIERNVRVSEKVLGDLRSCLAACFKAEQMLLAAVGKFGPEVVGSFFGAVQDYSERMTRSVIREIPDGTYSFVDHIDDGVVSQEPIRIAVTLRIDGDDIHFDLDGTSDQVPAAINCTLSFTKSACYAAVRTLVGGGVPNNSGVFRPIHVRVPPGTIANPHAPAAVASRAVTGFRVIDAALGALAKATRDRVPAAGEGGVSSFRIGGVHEGRSFIVWDSVVGTWGARPDRDGVDGCANFAGNLANAPVEVLEAEFPVRIHRYGLCPDSGGAGRFRGGLAVEREWELLSNEAVVTMRADRAKFAPWGLDGGGDGARSKNILNPETQNRTLPSKFTMRLEKGDRFLHRQAAGGGYGNPLDRDPEKVLADWRNGKVSQSHAREAYGVIIDAAAKSVDREATRLLRRTRSGVSIREVG